MVVFCRLLCWCLSFRILRLMLPSWITDRTPSLFPWLLQSYRCAYICLLWIFSIKLQMASRKTACKQSLPSFSCGSIIWFTVYIELNRSWLLMVSHELYLPKDQWYYHCGHIITYTFVGACTVIFSQSSLCMTYDHECILFHVRAFCLAFLTSSFSVFDPDFR